MSLISLPKCAAYKAETSFCIVFLNMTKFDFHYYNFPLNIVGYVEGTKPNYHLSVN